MSKVVIEYGKQPGSIETYSGEDKITFNLLGRTFWISGKHFADIMVLKPGLFSSGQIAFRNSSGGIKEIEYDGISFFMGFTIPRKAKKDYLDLVDALQRTGYRIVQG